MRRFPKGWSRQCPRALDLTRPWSARALSTRLKFCKRLIFSAVRNFSFTVPSAPSTDLGPWWQNVLLAYRYVETGQKVGIVVVNVAAD
jgi:hypothetical protein